MKVRNYHFDNIKGLLIILVVFGHFIEPLLTNSVFQTLYLIIYSFHMPLFIFISGYFSKPTTKGLKKLLIMLVKYQIIYALTYAILFGSSTSTAASSLSIFGIIEYALQPIWVLWFILSLIWWRLMIIIYEKYPKILIIFIAVIISFSFIPLNFRVLSIGRTLTFFPYFLSGYLAKKHSFDLTTNTYRKRAVSFFAIVLTAFWIRYTPIITNDIIYGASNLLDSQLALSTLFILKMVIYLIAAASSIIVIYLLPNEETWLADIGQKTLPIFLLHPFVFWVLDWLGGFDKLANASTVIELIILLLITFATVTLLKNRNV